MNKTAFKYYNIYVYVIMCKQIKYELTSKG